MGDMSEIDAKLNVGNESLAAGYYAFRIKKSESQVLLAFPDDVDFGLLSTQITKALEDIVERPSVQFDALADVETLRQTIERATKASDAVVRVNINVYGSREAMKDIGCHLSDHKVYLQRPDQKRPGSIYDNPHVIKFPQMQVPSIDDRPAGTSDKVSLSGDVQHFRQAISDVYASLKRGSRLKRLEGDNRLRTPLLP
jgi:hypothetical protein